MSQDEERNIDRAILGGDKHQALDLKVTRDLAARQCRLTPLATALARDFPRTQIILNHAGLPADRSPEGLAGWRKAMAALAGCPNVAVKISGLGQPGDAWTVAANAPIVRDTIGIFGIERCLFASNFPVDGLCATFDTIYAGFKTIVADLDPADQRRLFHDNAIRVYRLEPERAID